MLSEAVGLFHYGRRGLLADVLYINSLEAMVWDGAVLESLLGAPAGP